MLTRAAPLLRAAGAACGRRRAVSSAAVVGRLRGQQGQQQQPSPHQQRRGVSSTAPVLHGSGKDLKDAPRIKVQWVGKDGSSVETDGIVGESILEAAHRHEIDLEGACEGVCACSTCHVILEEEVFESLEEPSEEEEDMLDQAFGLTPTSRLGCQVELTEAMDGIKIKLPSATRNMYVDGHKPKPH